MMEDKNGWIEQSAGDFGAVVGHITREVIDGLIDNGVEG